MFQPRLDVIQIFSSFAQFEGDIFSQWVSDPGLRRNMEACLKQLDQSSPEFWSLYWYKKWKPELALPRFHLIAYLQETCYWASGKAIAGFANTKLTLSDCFQLAIAQVDLILKGFNPNQSSNLKSYAAVIFVNLIKENLRQNHTVDICSPWALLRKVSQKRLVESLNNTGLNPTLVAHYLLAWKCYKTIYVPQTESLSTRLRQLPEPDLSTLEAIATLYQQLHPNSEVASPDKLKKSLLTAAAAIRNYLYPRLDSLNTPIPGQDSGEFQDYLPSAQSDSLLHDLITQEEEQAKITQQAQIQQFLHQVISQLTVPDQELLRLYYGESLGQQQIAEQLGTKQYTVSRKLSKMRQSLLLQLGQWTQTSLHVSLTPDLLKDISKVLEEWLTYYHSNLGSNSNV